MILPPGAPPLLVVAADTAEAAAEHLPASTVAWYFAAAVVLIALNGLFVAYEFAILAAKRSTFESSRRAGRRSSKGALASMSDLSMQLAGAQLGITMASLGLGYVAEPAFESVVARILGGVLSEQVLHAVGLGVSLAVVVFLHLVLGEMVPKNLALAAPEPYRTAVGTVESKKAHWTRLRLRRRTGGVRRWSAPHTSEAPSLASPGTRSLHEEQRSGAQGADGVHEARQDEDARGGAGGKEGREAKRREVDEHLAHQPCDEAEGQRFRAPSTEGVRGEECREGQEHRGGHERCAQHDDEVSHSLGTGLGVDEQPRQAEAEGLGQGECGEQSEQAPQENRPPRHGKGEDHLGRATLERQREHAQHGAGIHQDGPIGVEMLLVCVYPVVRDLALCISKIDCAITDEAWQQSFEIVLDTRIPDSRVIPLRPQIPGVTDTTQFRRDQVVQLVLGRGDVLHLILL